MTCTCKGCSEIADRLAELQQLIHRASVDTFSANATNDGLAGMNYNDTRNAHLRLSQYLEPYLQEQSRLCRRLTNDRNHPGEHRGPT